MTLSAGSRLGPYEIESPIGAGGMGEVYKAKDTRLDRSVALKVLSDASNASEEVRQRFEREAKAISSLQHPNICTLYDVGREGEVDFLVMELLDGESLADRVAKGPMPIEEVLRVGIQIADALEKAHGSGIVHRDLKPGNVFLAERGVKLLDFGLAKLHAAAAPTSRTQMGQLPTEQLSAPLTSAGMILGTFQYMSPEQLEGKESDARSDLFALGCVLYEMATGKKAFSGTSQASLIGSIMSSSPPPVSSIAPMSPPALDRVISTCLEKDPKNRWHTAHDVRLQLAWIAEGGSQIGLPAPVAHHRKNRERLAWGIAALLALATAAATIGYLGRAPVAPRLVRFQVLQPEALSAMGAPKIAPDGSAFAFVGIDKQGKSQLWIRPLDSLAAHPIAGTEGVTNAVRPFWSADSRYLAYFVGTRLMKIAVDGGPPQKIADASSSADGTWNAAGVILFDGNTNDPIQRVEAAGGVPKIEQARPSGERPYSVAWPQFLPDGKHYLYISFGGTDEENGVRLAELGGGPGTRIVGGLSRAEFVPPSSLLFVRESTLVTQRFDAEAAKLVGEPVPVAEGLGISSVGLADFSASANGTLIYRAGQADAERFAWLDLQDGRTLTGEDPGDGLNPALSPDGRWLAVNRDDGKNQDIWLRDLKRGVSSRFTTDPKPEYTPLFTPDGKSLLFSRDLGAEGWAIVERSLDSSAERVLVPGAGSRQIPQAITPDGKLLLYMLRKETNGVQEFDLFASELAVGGKGRPFAATEFGEFGGSFSPDGKWLAYQSNESGTTQVYVQAFPDPGRKWQISTEGGTQPMWSRDGASIYYFSAKGSTLMRVAVRTSPSFDAEIPQELFPVALAQAVSRNRLLLAPDGKRLLFLTSAGNSVATPTTVVLNWDAGSGR